MKCSSQGFAIKGFGISTKAAPLKGELKGLWSLTVTGNWRLVFRYDEETNTACDIDLIDYH